VSASNARYLFLRHSAGEPLVVRQSDRYRWVTWRPGLLPLDKTLTDIAWVAFHYLRLFSNSCFSRVLAYDGEVVVHRSTVFPRWRRYPFMGDDDLQIGNVWTHPRHRGLGLAKEALGRIITQNARPGRAFWYVVSDDNSASISAATAVGFTRMGTGVRSTRFGMKLLGSFEITEPSSVIHQTKRTTT